MKNQYQFSELQNKESISNEDASRIFFKIQDAISKKPMTRFVQSIDEVGNLLKDGIYFISHNLILRKGKTQILAGKAFYVHREELLKFLSKTASEDDLRPMLLCPRFEDTPEFVIQIDEDQFVLYKI
jgi:hypothetical protein